MTRPFRRLVRRFARSEDGSASLEFALMSPLFLGLFLSVFELGMLMTRQMMLDRGLDIAVRDVRLGRYADVKPADYHDTLKAAICEAAAIIPDCLDRLMLEMTPRDPRAWTTLNPQARCRDVDEEATALGTFEISNDPNELMILRACAVFRPFMPLNGLGFALVEGRNGTYGLLARSAFVIEPREGPTS